MRYILKILLIFFAINGALSVNGQVFSLQTKIKWIVVDDSTGHALPYTHIFNESKRSGSITNKEGVFSIHADIGDTLVLSAVGYLSRVKIVGDLAWDSQIVIKLIPRLYEIDAVSIKSFRNYADFQHQFIALDLPPTRTDILRRNLARLSYTEAIEGVAQQKVRDALSPEPGRPMTGGAVIPILYRDDLLRINFAKVLEKEKKQRVIDKKYNREIIYKITLLSPDEITDFMGYCNFSMEYLLKATEYEILVMIEQKFKEYLDFKSQGWLFEEKIFIHSATS